MTWKAFPSCRSAKLLIGPNDALSNALNLYHPGSAKGKIAKKVLKFLPDTLSSHILPTHDTPRYLDDVHKDIQELYNLDGINLSISTGTPGPHQKQTIQVTYNNKIQGYAKLGRSNDAIKLIKSEHNNLQHVNRLNLVSATTPNTLGLVNKPEYTLLGQTCPDQPLKQRSLKTNDHDIAFLSELASKTHNSKSIDSVINDLDWHSIQDIIKIDSLSQWETWDNVINYISNTYAEENVNTCLCHGDYAPWNTLRTTKTPLYVFDWEYAEQSAPVLNDLFHYEFLPARLIYLNPPVMVLSLLERIKNNPIYQALLVNSKITTDKIPAYFMLYLIKQMIREYPNSRSTNYLTTCAHVILKHVGYTQERMRVLVGAYACEPNQGSEPGVGWHMSKEISKNHDVLVITRKNNRESIEAELNNTANPHLFFEYVDLPRWAAFWKKGGRGIRLYYYLWQLCAFVKARKLNQSYAFDIAHHVTFVNDYIYTFMALLPIPFVWGPLGSNPRWPAKLSPSRKAYFKDTLRSYIQSIIRAIDPLFWLSAIRARVILGIHPRIGLQFPFNFISKDKFLVHSAIGVEANALNNSDTYATNENKPFTALTMGKMLPIKGFNLSLYAFKRCLQLVPDAKLIIVGKGPDILTIQKIIKRLKLKDNVEIIDWLPRTKALETMKNADVFLYPSFEGSGMVTLEAMANGLPVIGLDFGGVGEMVDDDCGIKVKTDNFAHTTHKLGDALVLLAQNPALRASMSHNATNRVKNNYLWEKRAEEINSWYKQALENK